MRINSKTGEVYSILVIQGAHEIAGTFRPHPKIDPESLGVRKYGVVNRIDSDHYGQYYTFLQKKNTNENVKGSWSWITNEEYEKVFNFKCIEKKQ